MKILFVNYGRFDTNSGGHIAHFAARLHDRGHAVCVLGDGDPAGAGDFGPVRFHTAPRDLLADHPEAALIFDGHAPDPADTIVHAWTPREAVRTAVTRARRRTPFRTVIHLEDDETVLTAATLGRSWTELSLMDAAELDPLIPPSLSHPHRMSAFLNAADGITAIVPPLLSFAAGGPAHVLAPGCDLDEAGPPLREVQREALLTKLDIPADHKLLVYPGNLHAANRREMFSLYVGVQILRRRGLPVTLIRTGEDYSPAIDVAFEHLRGKVSRELGRLPRRELMVVLKLADLFVQPGAPDVFNRCRLPSKLPEFFAVGAPVLLPRANLGLQVVDGVEAVVLDRGDGVEIADRAEPLLRDPERARSIGEAGRRFAARTLDWDVNTGGLEAFYNHVLAQRAPGRRSEGAA